jgi:hypothetical protein
MDERRLMLFISMQPVYARQQQKGVRYKREAASIFWPIQQIKFILMNWGCTGEIQLPA